MGKLEDQAVADWQDLGQQRRVLIGFEQVIVIEVLEVVYALHLKVEVCGLLILQLAVKC